MTLSTSSITNLYWALLITGVLQQRNIPTSWVRYFIYSNPKSFVKNQNKSVVRASCPLPVASKMLPVASKMLPVASKMLALLIIYAFGTLALTQII
jgi:hypothetical protein